MGKGVTNLQDGASPNQYGAKGWEPLQVKTSTKNVLDGLNEWMFAMLWRDVLPSPVNMLQYQCQQARSYGGGISQEVCPYQRAKDRRNWPKLQIRLAATL